MSDEEEEEVIDEEACLYEIIPFGELPFVLAGLKPKVNLACYGGPGIGKSSLFKSHPDLQPVTIVGLSNRQAEDIGGCPMPDKETEATFIYPMIWFRKYSMPSEWYRVCQAMRGDEGAQTQCGKLVEVVIAPDWKSGYIACPDQTCTQHASNAPIALLVGTIVFDEFDKGTPEKQTAVMRILSERELEGFELSPLVRIIVISNREEDDAGVFYEMPNVTKNRLVHIGVKEDFEQWERDFATPNGISAIVISYLSEHLDQFCLFKPNERAFGFPTPRTWEYVSDILEGVESGRMPEEIGRRLVIGAVGRPTGVEFWTYRLFINACPPISELADGTKDFPPLSAPDKWVALVTRCVASAEAGLYRVPKENRVLQQVCQVLSLIPDEAALYRMMLATWLRRRPLTKHLVLDATAMGTDKHLDKLGDDLADMQRPQATSGGTALDDNTWG